MDEQGSGTLKPGGKAFLSVTEVAMRIERSRATVYRAIKNGRLPLPVYMVGGRMRIPTVAVERMRSGDLPVPQE